MKKTLLLTLLFALFTALGFSQTDKYWSGNTQSRSNIITAKAVARLAFPKEFKLFNLNVEPLRQELFSIVGKNASKHSTVISLPNADGQVEQFEVFEASNFEPALQAQFPEIRAYSGRGITDRGAMLKLSISPQGVQTMIFRNEKDNEFIEPYSLDNTVYAVYKSQRVKGTLPWTCSTDDKQTAVDLSAKISNTNKPTSSAGELKTMRLAQSVTAEYSNYFGATSAAQVGLVLAGINATMTRCNGVYEKDLAIHLNLIANTTDVIYYNAATDPYSPAGTGAGGAWNGELQATLTSVIGEANYDIGHLFGATGGGGNAGCIGCVCVNGSKGSGFTSPADGIPQGDNFDIDYVVHEVGHQLGGNHTFSMSIEAGGTNNVEVGSGITIMGYAGITAQDVAPHSIDIFHERSIQQIQNNMAGKTCPITTNITANNATPVVAPVTDRTIPISTPFVLTGSATDANPGDVLTYCWEQNDNANSTVTGTNSVASPTKLVGPNWLSFKPTTNPTRTCPVIETILAGLFVTPHLPGGDNNANIEALSSVARTLKFRLTVRDNAVYSPTAPVSVGQTSFTDMTVTVTASSGPFKVTQPNTALSWPASTTQTITWDVANTTAAPVSCSNVNILLSTDGGFTFPITLAANTANDGTEAVTIPNNVTTTARIKIESVGNIFFDISNTNFSITAAVADFGFAATTATTISCGGAPTADVTLGTTTSAGFATPIVLTATAGVPSGTTVTFVPSSVIPGNSATVTLNNVNSLANGTYNITITGTAGTSIHTTIVTYIVSAGTASINTQPSDVSLCLPANTAVFGVAATGAGLTFQWQINTGSGFTDIAGETNPTLNLTGLTAASNGNQYRVVINGSCTTAPIMSNAATLTVNSPAVITTEPMDVSTCTASAAVFTTTATGTTITYQWQMSVNGGTTFVNVPNAAPFTGVTTNTLTVSPVTTAYNGYIFHLIASGTPCGSDVSDDVTLTVNTLPVVVLTAASYSGINPYLRETLYATVSPAGDYTYQWFRDGILVPALTSDRFDVTVDDLGTYEVVVTDVTTGCISRNSNSATVDAASSSTLFIFPNPSSGQFQVRYYSASNSTARTLTVYDSKGSRIYTQSYPVTGPYTKMDVNLDNAGSGVYMVELRDAGGKRMAIGKVVIK